MIQIQSFTSPSSEAFDPPLRSFEGLVHPRGEAVLVTFYTSISKSLDATVVFDLPVTKVITEKPNTNLYGEIQNGAFYFGSQFEAESGWSNQFALCFNGEETPMIYFKIVTM